jgi:hypothetical protein
MLNPTNWGIDLSSSMINQATLNFNSGKHGDLPAILSTNI